MLKVLTYLKLTFPALKYSTSLAYIFNGVPPVGRPLKTKNACTEFHLYKKLKKENLTQNKVFVFAWLKFVDALDDIFGGPLTNLDIVVQDDKPHFQSLSILRISI